MVTTIQPAADTKPRLPIEVCESVIVAVYDDRYGLVPTALTTLSTCALVCRAWRPHAQKILFRYVVLRDQDALHRFAALLDISPELGGHVRLLVLRGHLHVPSSPAVLFPTVLRGRLTMLLELRIYEFDPTEKIVRPLPKGKKELPTLPIHRHFPSLLTSLSRIRTLKLWNIRFPSFGDFARILQKLLDLEELCCDLVSWAVLGQIPPFMAEFRPHGSRSPFLPQLQCLRVSVPI